MQNVAFAEEKVMPVQQLRLDDSHQTVQIQMHMLAYSTFSHGTISLF